MDRLWTPWRMKYIKKPKTDSCVLCEKIKDNKDSENYILLRKQNVVSLLNLYPYNNGHVMIVPVKHTACLEDLNQEETAEIFSQIQKVSSALKRSLNAQGFNIGLNLGEVSGAGIAQHIHFHIVPRWQGDTNFMPILGKTKVIPQTLEETFNIIQKELNKIEKKR
jgi:ATP adenylyltransferase